jgi:multiple sugar transport system ATP-binding protein
LVVNHLTKKFSSLKAVEDVSLEVKDGEFAVILGPSGSGKTTLLRCLAGLEDPDAGTISIGGRNMAGVEPRQREISMVFQSYALFPLMSIRENIAFPLRVRGRSRNEIDTQVEELAGRLKIPGLLDKMPKQLIGGEQQRVALARALAVETKAILMDEPLSNLDAPLRAQLRVDLKSLQQDFGRTIIYVTHDQVEAMTLADRIGVMRSGRLLQYDVPQRVYSSPSSSFVTGFVGNPPSSMLKLTVSLDGGSVRLSGPAVELSVPDSMEGFLRSYSGREVILAIRAEGITLEESPGQKIRCSIKLIERLGASTFVNLTAGNYMMKSIAPGTFDAPIGTPVLASLDLTKASVFDPLDDSRIA